MNFMQGLDRTFKPLSDLDPSFLLNSHNRRISTELSAIFAQCENYAVTKVNDGVAVRIKRGKREFSMVLDSSYPFKPPIKITVNGATVKQICMINGDIFDKYLLRYYGASCLCCHSIIFNDGMWGPCFKMTHVINEIETILIVKQKILLSMLCDKIRCKYNCLEEFAPFESYLLYNDQT